MTMQHTPEQTAVIQADCRNILVSAAAGSGKTAVLTDRIVRRVVEGKLDIQQVLVVTFTDAAARSMRGKIETKLRAALESEQDPARRRLISRQISWLPGAAISTIHAFCLNVIRNFYYCALDEQGRPLVEPGFTVDDGVTSDLLLRQTLDEWMNGRYEAIDRAETDGVTMPDDETRAFYRLVDGYGNSSGDLPVRELMIRLHHFLRSLPDYQDFARLRLQELEQAAARFTDSPHCLTLLRQLRLRLDRALAKLPELQDLLAGDLRFIADNSRNQRYKEQFQAAFNILRQLDVYLADGGADWDEIRRLAASLTDLDLPRAGRADTPEKTEFMTIFCESAAEVVFFLSGSCGTPKCSKYFIFPTTWLFNRSAQEIEADIAAMLPSVRQLINGVLELDERYAEQKRAAGMIDFNDFEHLALAILRQDEAAHFYRDRFREIYVDEYQDTSSIQDAIIQAVGRDNCLMVGDMKQSIYRFRHARPAIFRQKADTFRDGRSGRLFELNRNFRSVAGVLAAANDLFSQLMSVGAGEMAYDGHQALAPYRPDPPDVPAPVEVMLLNRSKEQPAAAEADSAAEMPDGGTEDKQALDDLNKTEQEAQMVIGEIRRLVKSGSACGDMVILCRTRAVAQIYRDRLEADGLPVQADLSGRFLDAPVIRLMEALIDVLDNTRQDIPLAAVLRADLHTEGLTLDDMARIRLFGRNQQPPARYFHQAVFSYRDSGPDPALRNRVTAVLDWLEHLRAREPSMRLGELVGLIFSETHWLEKLAAEENGEEQVALLRRFQQWAEQFERNRQQGLYRFARYLESLRRRDNPETPAAQADTGAAAIRVMTIHGSKGLEFPIVFLVGTGSRLAVKESQEHLLISENLGIGMDYADPERQIRYPTHLKLAMLEEVRAAGLAEELRLLYVAMTRAMNRLYLIGTANLASGRDNNRLSAVLEQARQCTGRTLPDYLVLSCQSMLEWILLALARNPGLDLSVITGQPSEGNGSLTKNTTRNFTPHGDIPPGLLDYAGSWAFSVCTPADIGQDLAPDMTLDAGSTLDDNGSSGRTSDRHAESVPVSELLSEQEQELEQDPDPEQLDQIRRRLALPYRYERAARTPIKLTVSELKRREQELAGPDHDECPPPGSAPALPRGIDLSLREMARGDTTETIGHTPSATGAQLGTLLHTVFRYLDLPAARQKLYIGEIERQLNAMAAGGMIAPDDLEKLEPYKPQILAFAASDLAGELAEALADRQRQAYFEMPFTLALPACEVFGLDPGLAPNDRVLVQGIIDCWFQQEKGVTLIDYKSDRLTGDDQACLIELRRRYGRQLDYYAKAIEAAAGIRVCRKLIWHIGRARTYPMD